MQMNKIRQCSDSACTQNCASTTEITGGGNQVDLSTSAPINELYIGEVSRLTSTSSSTKIGLNTSAASAPVGLTSSNSEDKESNGHNDIIASDVSELQSLLKDAENEMKELRQKLKNSEKTVKQMQQEMNQAKEQEELVKNRLMNEIEAMKKQVRHMTETKVALENNVKEKEKEVAHLQNKLDHSATVTRSASAPLIHSSSSPPWVPDWFADCCHSCGYAFSLLRRKHHCRLCGNIFCGRCSNNSSSVPLTFYGSARVRVCNSCSLALKFSTSKSSDSSFPGSRNSFY